VPAALSGIARCELSQSTDGRAFTSVSTGLTTSSVIRNLAPGHTSRFRLRGIDRAGNVGAWMAGRAFTLRAISQSSAAVRYRGTWNTSRSTTWWGGTARSSSTLGSTASYTFTGRSIAWVGLKSSNRGKAQIYVNGVLKSTIDLYSADKAEAAHRLVRELRDVGDADLDDQGLGHDWPAACRHRRFHRRELGLDTTTSSITPDAAGQGGNGPRRYRISGAAARGQEQEDDVERPGRERHREEQPDEARQDVLRRQRKERADERCHQRRDSRGDDPTGNRIRTRRRGCRHAADQATGARQVDRRSARYAGGNDRDHDSAAQPSQSPQADPHPASLPDRTPRRWQYARLTTGRTVGHLRRLGRRGPSTSEDPR